MEPLFRDRREAGRYLAERLTGYWDRPDVIVLALPRGGVPVAFEVAKALNAPLDIFLVRKLGVPGHEELALGAIASGGVRVLNQELIDAAGISSGQIDAIAGREARELERRERAYRGDRPSVTLAGKCVILVDDGLATGASMRAAVRAVRQQGASRTVVAVPVAAPESCADMQEEADDVICATRPQPFFAVGLWYQDFAQTTDDEVRELLARAWAGAAATARAAP